MSLTRRSLDISHLLLFKRKRMPFSPLVNITGRPSVRYNRTFEYKSFCRVRGESNSMSLVGPKSIQPLGAERSFAAFPVSLRIRPAPPVERGATPGPPARSRACALPRTWARGRAWCSQMDRCLSGRGLDSPESGQLFKLAGGQKIPCIHPPAQGRFNIAFFLFLEVAI